MSEAPSIIQDTPPIVLRLVDVPEPHEERCRRLARERGWYVLSPQDTASPDVVITREGGVRLMPTARGPVKLGPRTPQVWLVESAEAFPPPPGAEMIQRIPVEAPDVIWVALIENSVQMGRLLNRFHERINHLQQVSTTDALTGLSNRAHLQRVLSTEYKRHQRTGAPLACIMIDLDHFKNINDTYGHSFGDQILSAFAQLLSDAVRETDVVGRYGGEEFLCVLPNTDVEGAAAVAEKLRRVVEARVFTEGFFNIELTASFGVSSTGPDVTTEGALLQLADRALYRAKQSGRNRVCIADGSRSGVQESPARLDESTSGNRPTILIAHRHPEQLQFYKSLVEERRFNLVTVTNSDDAMRWLTLHTPTAALVKSNLKPMSGWDLIDRIRSKTSDQYFPIAILESHTGSSDGKLASRTGADDVFSEDIGRDEFGRRIQVFFRLKLLHDRFNETYERLTAARARLVKAERLSTLGQMASGVAHDFNNALSTILGRTERLLRLFAAEPVGEELRLIQRAAADGARSVRRIQEFSRTISNLDASATPVGDVVDDCIDVTRVRWKDEAERHGLRIAILNRVNPDLKTLANPGELREVFIKLFTNALDAMPRGGEIIVRSIDDPREERFAIEVEDTGVGMEPAVLRRVFEPFFTTKHEGGTGLGLSIVYGIVTRLGGMIEAESHPGQGTVFRLWFPRADEVAAEAERRQPAPMPVELAVQSAGPALRVLVVEDESSVRNLFVDVLGEEGCVVDEAECARDAMALMENKIYDAVLTDLGMPDLPGWEVARFAKQKCPRTRVILSSGWGDEYSREELQNRGVDHWLPKPVSLDELFTLIRSVEPVPQSDPQSMA